MKISASIYSNKKRSLKDLIKELDSVKIDMFHVDFNDKKMNYSNSLKNIINGGRYDQLISDLGSKKKISAVGAALNLNY